MSVPVAGVVERVGPLRQRGWVLRLRVKRGSDVSGRHRSWGLPDGTSSSPSVPPILIRLSRVSVAAIKGSRCRSKVPATPSPHPLFTHGTRSDSSVSPVRRHLLCVRPLVYGPREPRVGHPAPSSPSHPPTVTTHRPDRSRGVGWRVSPPYVPSQSPRRPTPVWEDGRSPLSNGPAK